MTKKKSSKHQEEPNKTDYRSIAGGEITSVEADPIEPPSLAEYALMMAAEARVMSLCRILFPLLERIEAGEKITEKEILDTLSSVKVGNKTALEKLSYLREQQ